MAEPFPIIQIPDDAPLSLEDMGSKEKFWFRDAATGEKCLFKAARPGTGEDWAEKVAGELAGLLGLPHAHYELAVWRNKPGVVAPRFVPRGGALIHGNELLGLVDKTYPQEPVGSRVFCRVPQHTLDRVIGVLSKPAIRPPLGWPPEEEVQSAPELFVGYLLLDAWIGNTDRHHENWGLILSRDDEFDKFHVHLAPTFDHASCLGRELSDERRTERLKTNDPKFSVTAYSSGSKARSALYLQEQDPRPMGLVEAFVEAARRRPTAGKWWVGSLLSIQEERICGTFEQIPKSRMSEVAVEFSLQMLKTTRQRIREAAEAHL